MNYDYYNYGGNDMLEVIFPIFMVSLITNVVFGFISKKINENKGYNGGFAWGFFLGIIGIIVVAIRSNNGYSSYQSNDYQLKQMSREKHENDILREGGWRCQRCNNVNPKYQTSCNCGYSLSEQKKYLEEQHNKQKQQEELKMKEEKMKLVLSQKKMLDEGLITQEEFEEQKKQLLGL